MDFMNTFRLALRALARNKMRSALTMLGIIIGVGAVIAVVSIGQGANYMVQQGIAAMGTNAVFIAAGSNRAGGVRQGYGGVKTLTIDDMNAILRGDSAHQAGRAVLVEPPAGRLRKSELEHAGSPARRQIISIFAPGPCSRARSSAMRKWISPRMCACSEPRSRKFIPG